MKKLSELARQLGRAGGRKSVQVRLAGKSKAEISKIMSDVRKGKGHGQGCGKPKVLGGMRVVISSLKRSKSIIN